MGRTLPLALLWVLAVQTYAQTPGGVNTNLQLWLRAEGYTGTATWTDNSGNGRNATKTGTVANTARYNFQAVPTGLTAANYFSVAHHANLNTNSGAISVFAVGLAGNMAYSPFVAKTADETWPTGWVLATSSPTSDIGFTTGDWEGVGTTNVAKQSGVSTTIPAIVSGFGSGAATNVVTVSANGTAGGTNTSTKTSSNVPLRVGFDGDVYGFSGGSIAEVIVYNADLSAANRQRVWSYLAIKYGITLNNGGTNYISSSSATVWNTTTNAGYNSNIFGIGLDNTSGLSQRQSTSINGGLQPVIANGTTLVALNSSGTALGTNNSFLIAGSDNGATTFSTALTGLTGLNSRLGRIWKVQETGTVGNVTIAWPETDATVKLIVSNDATFNGSDVAVATTSITINGTVYRMATVDLTTGQYFTFGMNIIAPGGQWTNMGLWLAADAAGVATGAAAPDWDDISRSKNAVEAVGTMTLQAGGASNNFQPYFGSFSSTAHFKDANSSLAPQNTFQAGEVTLFAVARINSLTNDGRIMGIDDTDLNGTDPALSIVDASANLRRTSTSAVNATSPVDAALNASAIYSAYTSGTTAGVGMNGDYSTSTITAGGGMTGDVLMVGYGNAGTSGALPGELQEAVWYTRSLSATERKQVESYLALKYGITLGGNAGTGSAYNYLSSAGTTVWDKTTNSGYNNDIAGIGRDDASGLTQKQSNSVNGTGSVTMSLGAIAATNTANANTFSQDRSFLIWGHNGAAHNTVFNDPVCFSQLPTGVQARVQRKWKMQATNFAQNVTVAIDVADLVGYTPASNLRLLVDNDGTDWTNATVYSSATISGGRVQFSNVGFTAARPFFTLATINFASTPLPVELIAFQGEPMGTVNHLTWSTATERDNDRFEVERSADGEAFGKIGTVGGAGTSQQPIHYALDDAAPLNGVNYYRLKQVDLDGTYTYSPVIVLVNDAAGLECTVRTLADDGLYLLACPLMENAVFEVFNTAGQPVPLLRSTTNAQEVDLRSLRSGMYFARITDGVSVKSYKLIRP